MHKTFLTTLLLLLCPLVWAGEGADMKHASWISVAGAPATDYGVYYFRKSLTLAARPATYPVSVSADNRYKLYVNGTLVSAGPARSDVAHWRYETVDLAPHLRAGDNCVVAQVWNEGPLRPVAQPSLRTAFALRGATPQADAIQTGRDWLCIRDTAYAPLPVRMSGYYAAGPGETVDMSRRVADWLRADCDTSRWQRAEVVYHMQPRIHMDWGLAKAWAVEPSPLPQMEHTAGRFARVRDYAGATPRLRSEAQRWIEGRGTLRIQPHTETTLLLDRDALTNAYVSLAYRGGRGATLSLSYQESLFERYPVKGHRDEVAGKTLTGRRDSLILGTSGQGEWTSLSWRTYRYALLRVRTGDEALTLTDIHDTFTGYPFRLGAGIDTDDGEIQRIFSTGWRTARLCAMETYMDCPYYEQLQYLGDTRIQALVTLYCTGDDRLVRNFLTLADRSRSAEGITHSRWPSAEPQYISPYALSYVGALHDYMMYGSDTQFVAQRLAGVRQIMEWFARYQGADGSLRGMDWWNFTDWVDNRPEWEGGVLLPGSDGASAVLDLKLLWTLRVAAEMEETLGMKAYADLYRQRAAQLMETVQRKYWDEACGLFADQAEHTTYSQHTGAMAILSGAATPQQAARIAARLETDKTLASASIYFSYYLHRALIRAGMGDGYMGWLDKWRENLSLGLTTWAETSDVARSRSDCHAWGSSPNVELLRTVLGIDSDAPGFRRVRIEPHLGDITRIGGHMPHPAGEIRVQYEVSGGTLHAAITLPRGVAGELVWRGKTLPLTGGENRVTL